ncbi:MAG: hypothetical protein DMF77_09175 [Acidobacteria bacterium]|nr:MAG: hypothetical protein DMF77_09175 [Acidobacteriota bacterium]
MDELVPEHVVGLGQGRADGEDDTPLEGLGDAARALAGSAAEGVGLLEVGIAGVQDDGLALLHLVAEQGAEPGVPTLGHASDLLRRQLLLGVVIDVEMIGLEDLELQPVPLDRVAPEVLGVGGWGEGEGEDRDEGENEARAGSHSPPGDSASRSKAHATAPFSGFSHSQARLRAIPSEAAATLCPPARTRASPGVCNAPRAGGHIL